MLSTLEMAVADYNAKYNDIRSLREAEVERTKAEKSFRAASLTVLDEFFPSLSALLLAITEVKNSLSHTRNISKTILYVRTK